MTATQIVAGILNFAVSHQSHAIYLLCCKYTECCFMQFWEKCLRSLLTCTSYANELLTWSFTTLKCKTCWCTKVECLKRGLNSWSQRLKRNPDTLHVSMCPKKQRFQNWMYGKHVATFCKSTPGFKRCQTECLLFYEIWWSIDLTNLVRHF